MSHPSSGWWPGLHSATNVTHGQYFCAYCTHKSEVHREVEHCAVLAVAAFCVWVGTIFVSGLSAGRWPGVCLTVFRHELEK